jgi:hypothetical protein
VAATVLKGGGASRRRLAELVPPGRAHLHEAARPGVPTGAAPVNQFPKQQAESGEIGWLQAPFDSHVADRLFSD